MWPPRQRVWTPLRLQGLFGLFVQLLLRDGSEVAPVSCLARHPDAGHEEQPRDHRVEAAPVGGDRVGLAAAGPGTVAGGEQRPRGPRRRTAALGRGPARRRSAGSRRGRGRSAGRPGAAGRRAAPGSPPRRPRARRSPSRAPRRGARRGRGRGSHRPARGRRTTVGGKIVRLGKGWYDLLSRCPSASRRSSGRTPADPRRWCRITADPLTGDRRPTLTDDPRRHVEAFKRIGARRWSGHAPAAASANRRQRPSGRGLVAGSAHRLGARPLFQPARTTTRKTLSRRACWWTPPSPSDASQPVDQVGPLPRRARNRPAVSAPARRVRMSPSRALASNGARRSTVPRRPEMIGLRRAGR